MSDNEQPPNGMTGAAHTPGPWFVDGVYISAPDGEREPWQVAMMMDFCGEPVDQTPANAARIVACVNALEGIPDPSVVGEAIEALRLVAKSKTTDQRLAAVRGAQAIIAKLDGSAS